MFEISIQTQICARCLRAHEPPYCRCCTCFQNICSQGFFRAWSCPPLACHACASLAGSVTRLWAWVLYRARNNRNFRIGVGLQVHERSSKHSIHAVFVKLGLRNGVRPVHGTLMKLTVGISYAVRSFQECRDTDIRIKANCSNTRAPDR